ncbi:uncharacterized protein L969DRAFT_42819 [Mixia osmundae IAM 14324]|uniref:SHSP domain-containing protein n=1 Tax=Mixia osmundae (strain CBS 9802 / IAM 14324 / JCM 22182 / KY 12970) TaxID=764103 RepID=G7DTL4_MIXOS|nr:uncharacterized protein L969DRAFT_42819 [Mixia osmundae IAM 14324]KEI42802.1 hypothetical protein L969DRAFT_42819 [Mixia osmundae IAM 14324]GAA93861.1 hypothetical protein E5Q_00507 [Mixia osmundae IAM 14324]
MPFFRRRTEASEEVPVSHIASEETPRHRIYRDIDDLFDMSLSRVFPELRTALRMLEDPFFTRSSVLPSLFEGPLSRGLQHKMIQPAVDVHEQKDGYMIEVEIPGAKKEDLEVSFGENGQVLSLSGKVERSYATKSHGSSEQTEAVSKESESQVITRDEPAFSERIFGSFRRSIRLPEPVDTKSVTATYANGVLSIEAKKKLIEGANWQPISIA